MKRFNCSIVGLGRIGSLLEDDSLREKPASHAGAIAANPHCRLISGCDIDKEKCSLFAERWVCSDLFQDFDTMISFKIPDILCIATPPETHREFVLKSIDKGIPLVICEKPLTEDDAEAEEIINKISQSSTILMVNHERRYSLDYLHLKEIIESNIYGNLLSLNCKLYMGQKKTVEEMLWEDGTHMIDVIRFLTEKEVSSINVIGNLFDKDGECVIVLKMEPLYVIIDAACNRDHLVFELDLSFSKGMVKIGNGVFEEYRSKTSPFYDSFKSLVKKQAKLFPKTNYFAGMLEDAVKVLQDDGRKIDPVSMGMDGYHAVKIISEIIKKNRKV